MAWSDWMSTKHVLAKQKEADRQKFIKNFSEAFEVINVRSDQGVGGSCSKCGASIAGQYADLGNQIYLCQNCTDEKVEQRGFDKDYLPWNQWRLPAHKKPVKLG